MIELRSLTSLLLLSSIGLGCARDAREESGKVGGTIVLSASADADVLVPPLTFSLVGKQVVDQMFDNLADIGEDLNTVGDAGFTPRLARRWRWGKDSLSIDFELDPRARWHDGRPVRAGDVEYTFRLIKDPALASPLASSLDNVDSVSVVDSLTARVWLKERKPDAFFKVAQPVAILPSHLLGGSPPGSVRAGSFGGSPVGSGKFRFSAWDRGARIVLVADSGNYRGRPRSDRLIWLVSADYPAAAVRFLTGAADFIDVLRPEYVGKTTAEGKEVRASKGSLDYGYVAFNLVERKTGRPHPVLGDRELRRALVMSVDRAALVRSVFDTFGLVSHGPATRLLPTSDTTVSLPYDTARAARALDSLGWRRGSDGIRRRGNTPLAFSLIVASSSANRMKLAVLLQDQWRKAGAKVSVDPIELNTFGARMEERNFDALLNAWHIEPTPSSVREEWASSEIKPGGYNAASYRNAQFDAVVDSATREASPRRSVELYRRAYRILAEDAPALWLYELRNVYGVSKRVQPAGLRSDAWWRSLDQWSVADTTATRD
ncbi:MAG: peptide ABC transporter substrate-binding protein [Gemmatimonadota bacterium]|nr:peptide ABC transporter substrate-binding protein [Gemmatimonadota bacterium]